MNRIDRLMGIVILLQSKHFRVTSYCWAIYLKVLKGYLEKGIQVKYEERYD
ncbi:MAG: hypothetical protein WBB12_12060 [Saprospiraceae bacterium]